MNRREQRRIEAIGVSNGCSTGKVAYSTRQGAKAAASRLRRKGIHITPYPCDLCDAWHNGHLPQRVMTGDIVRDEYYGRGRNSNR